MVVKKKAAVVKKAVVKKAAPKKVVTKKPASLKVEKKVRTAESKKKVKLKKAK